MSKSSDFERYGKLSDEELVEKSFEDKKAETVLTARYSSFVRACANKYASRCPWSAEDFSQEGFLGFLNAVRTFDKSRGVTFRAYVGVCITRRIISSMKKNMPQGGKEDFCEESENVVDSDKLPEEVLIEKETEGELYRKMFSLLSGMEQKVFTLYLQGKTYGEISEIMDIPLKSADNAMQRVRKKLSIFRKDF